MTTTPPSPSSSSSSSSSMAPRSSAGRGRAPRLARAVQRRAPLDAFGDAPLARARATKKPLAVPAVVVLGALAAAVCAVAVAVPALPVLVGVLAVAVVAGGWLPGRALARFLPLLAGAAAAVVVVVARSAGASTDVAALDSAALDSAALAVCAALSVLGFGGLPRTVLFLAVHGARRAERARADAEVLRLVDDARLFRRLGNGRGADDSVDAAAVAQELKDVGCAVAQRDRLYRLLRLAERSVKDTAVTALYVVDDAGTALVLVEQLSRAHAPEGHEGQDGDASNKPKLALGGRGVGAAGLVGLCFTRRAPLRVVDVDGAAVRAHRASGPMPQSALCVPLLARGGACRGVLVLDRSEPVSFDAADEAFALALGEELLDGLQSEQLVDDLEAERRRVARVYAAARALAGVTRTADVVDVAVDALAGLCASVAIVDVDTSTPDAPARVLAATGALAGLKPGALDGALDADGFAARALSDKVTLPHTALAKAQPRPILGVDDGVDVGALGDLRVVPLLAHGEARGVIVVALAKAGAGARADRFSMEVVDAVVAVADVVALALSSARSFDAVEKQATTDGLTGVCNRRALDRRLDEAVARAKRSGQPLCVLLTDVDHFKSVNDAWGHGTGDEVLKGVAKMLEQQARGTDVVGRLGGEEFVVVCETTDLQGGLTGAERMRLAIKAMTFETGKGPLSVTSSFGVALWQPGESGHAVLERADQALYKAKTQGRDRVIA